MPEDIINGGIGCDTATGKVIGGSVSCWLPCPLPSDAWSCLPDTPATMTTVEDVVSSYKLCPEADLVWTKKVELWSVPADPGVGCASVTNSTEGCVTAGPTEEGNYIFATWLNAAMYQVTSGLYDYEYDNSGVFGSGSLKEDCSGSVNRYWGIPATPKDYDYCWTANIASGGVSVLTQGAAQLPPTEITVMGAAAAVGMAPTASTAGTGGGGDSVFPPDENVGEFAIIDTSGVSIESETGSISTPAFSYRVSSGTCDVWEDVVPGIGPNAITSSGGLVSIYLVAEHTAGSVTRVYLDTSSGPSNSVMSVLIGSLQVLAEDTSKGLPERLIITQNRLGPIRFGEYYIL